MREKVVTGVFWSAVQNWGRQLISFAVFVVLSRLVAPADFGLIALGTTFIALAQIVLDQGFTESIIQTSSLTDRKLSTAFWTNVLFGSAMTICSFLFARLIALLFSEPRLAEIVVGLAPIFIFVAFRGVHEAILKRELRFKILAKRSLAGIFVGGLVGITMALYGFGAWALVGQIVSDQLTSTLMIWYAMDWRPKWTFSREDFRELFSFGINVLGFQFLTFINRRSDDLLIGYVLGAEILGFYTVAYRILKTLTTALLGVISSVALPTFSRIQNNDHRMKAALQDASRFAALLAFPIFIGLFIVASDMIIVVYGEQWVPSIPVARILSLIGILHTIVYFKGTVWVAKGKPDWRLKFSLLSAVGNLTAFIIAVPFGIAMVALGYVLRGYLFAPISIFLTKRLIGITFKEYFEPFIPAAVSSGLMMGVILLLNHFVLAASTPYVRLLVDIIVGGCVYVLGVGLFFPSFWSQIKMFTNEFRAVKESS